MKLATIHDGTADGRLVVVARGLEHVATADGIARTLQDALERWNSVSGPLQALYDKLNAGTAAAATGLGNVPTARCGSCVAFGAAAAFAAEGAALGVTTSNRGAS